MDLPTLPQGCGTGCQWLLAAVLRAIGWSRRRLIALIFGEAAIIAFIGACLGVVSAFIAVFWQLLVREYLAPAAGREAEDETGGGGGE